MSNKIIKKILLLSFLFISIFSFYNNSFAVCTDDSSVSDCLNSSESKPESLVGINNDSYDVNESFKTQILNIIKTLSSILSIIAIGAIAFSGLKMTLSQGKDEDIKKSKDIIKWTIIGYLGLMSSGAIIAIVINFVYGIGGN
ncbi:MAG: pilin [Candidatus Gracilibacteria bacterium]|nr:pilin [Candidatus Gracilibacteria bacterium]